MGNSKRVYSTAIGRIKEDKENLNVVGNGDVKVRLETKKRAGKSVTVITGLPLNNEDLKALAKSLKAHTGGGGTVKKMEIQLQGSHVDWVIATLQKSGYKAKRSGG